MELLTIPQACKAVKSAKRVFIKVRFGVSEHNVKITKAEATFFLSSFVDSTTPRELEMYLNNFGYVDVNGDVCLG
jgi:hypothetical protein